MEQFWVSAIIQNEHDERAWLCTINNSFFSIKDTMDAIKRIRNEHTVLSAWINTFDADGTKHTVFHECYINALGYVTKPETTSTQQNHNTTSSDETKTSRNITELDDNELFHRLSEIDDELKDFHISGYKCQLLYEERDEIKSKLRRHGYKTP